MDGGVLFFGNFLSLQRYGLASRLCYIAAAQLSKSFYNLVIRVDHSIVFVSRSRIGSALQKCFDSFVTNPYRGVQAWESSC